MCSLLSRSSVGIVVCLPILMLTGCYSMNGYVMNASGQGYYEQGNYAMAAREFQTALASNPHNANYIANLAKTRMKLGDRPGAEKLYQQALTVSPAHQPSYHGYAELLLAQNRGQEALRMMNAWAATQPYVPESHVELAWLQRELGQKDAAAQTLQRALQVNPNHATALAHLGQYYHESGDTRQAVAMYQQALRADWNQPEVHSRLALAAGQVGAGHPMSEMAMSRGFDPSQLARQQLAAGPPPAGIPQMVGGPAMHRGPAMQRGSVMQPSGLPTVQGSGPVEWSTQAPTSVAWQDAATPGTFPPTDGSLMMSTGTPFPVESFGNTPSDGSVFPVTDSFLNGSVESTVTPGPEPDPAFSAGSSVPVTSISSTTTEEVPTIEAF